MADIPTFTRGVARSRYPAAQRRRSNKLAESAAAPSGDVVNSGGIGTQAYRTTSFAVPTNTLTPVDWTGSVYDSAGWFDLSSPSKITVDRAGLYLVQACINWTSLFGSVDRYAAQFLVNGSSPPPNVSAESGFDATLTSQSQAITMTRLVSLAAGDYVQVSVICATDNALNVHGHLSVTLVGGTP